MNIRFSAEEKLALETAARQHGFRGVSDYVRAAALLGAGRVMRVHRETRHRGGRPAACYRAGLPRDIMAPSMVYRGHIRNGVAVLNGALTLPDGTPVRIEVEREGSPFWGNRTLEQLAREQGVNPVANLNELTGEWPVEDSIDDFLGFLREVRR